MVKRTNMNLDSTLVSQAAEVLGTTGATETVHAAMNEVVRSARRKRLAARDFEDLTPEVVEQMRSARSAQR